MIASAFVGFYLAMTPMRAHATKPCPPDSWFSNPKQSAAEWRRSAKWVVVAKVKERTEIVVPFANCALKDRSQCEMDDRSSLLVEVLRTEKGKEKISRLVKGYCAPPPPDVSGGTFRFYGVGPESYIYFERVRPG